MAISRIILVLFISFSVLECYGQQSEAVREKTLQDPWRSKSVRRAASPGGMWFGPRLGKRALKDSIEAFLDSPISDDRLSTIERLLDAAEHGKSDGILEFVDAPGLIAYPGGKRRFTPRLGREMTLPELSDDLQLETPRSVNYIPRLGRQPESSDTEGFDGSNDAIITRLSQLLSREMYGRGIQSAPDSGTRLVESPGRPPFAPRLGRLVPPQPRLGREFNLLDGLTSQRLTRSAKL